MTYSSPPLDRLPEELMVLVLMHLDTLPPSEINARDEPNLDLTQGSAQPLKNASLVSRRWRRIALPLLFECALLRFRLEDTGSRLQMICQDCDACSVGNRMVANDALLDQSSCGNLLSAGIDQYHLDISQDIISAIRTERSGRHELCPEETFHYESMLLWPALIYHTLRQFLDFVQKESLQRNVQSLLICSDPMSFVVHDTVPSIKTAASDWRAIACAMFWHHLFSNINPGRVSILAPPTALACITSCAIDTHGDWAFGDMDYHLLQLRQAGRPTKPWSIDAIHYTAVCAEPSSHPRIAERSVLNLRDWTHVSLNEASFLQAYSTYHFFERGPPSLINTINRAVSGHMLNIDRTRSHLASLESFTYTAIFPFCTHLNVTPLLHRIITLDLQLAPLSASNILNDPLRVGRADLSDCWSELLINYENLVRCIGTFSISTTNCPKLQKFICRDVQILALQAELDQVFEGLCLPVWIELGPGIFTRVAESAETVMRAI